MKPQYYTTNHLFPLYLHVRLSIAMKHPGELPIHAFKWKNTQVASSYLSYLFLWTLSKMNEQFFCGLFPILSVFSIHLHACVLYCP